MIKVTPSGVSAEHWPSPGLSSYFDFEIGRSCPRRASSSSKVRRRQPNYPLPTRTATTATAWESPLWVDLSR
jgi:hypothetical protein